MNYENETQEELVELDEFMSSNLNIETSVRNKFAKFLMITKELEKLKDEEQIEDTVTERSVKFSNLITELISIGMPVKNLELTDYVKDIDDYYDEEESSYEEEESSYDETEEDEEDKPTL